MMATSGEDSVATTRLIRLAVQRDDEDDEGER